MASEDAEVFRRFVTSVLRLQTALLAHGDAMNAPHGQSSARWRILLQVARGEDSVPAIAMVTGSSRQAVQRLVDSLAEDGLLRLRPDPGDRRRRRIAFTARGRRTFRRLEAHFDRWSAGLVAELGVEHLDALAGELTRIRTTVLAGADPDSDPGAR